MRLDLEPDITVVGEAGDGLAALTLAARLAPDVILTEIDALGMDGIRLVEAMHRSTPTAAIVILSFHDDGATRRKAFAAGATAFVSKHSVSDQLLDNIRQAVFAAAATVPGESDAASAGDDVGHVTRPKNRDGRDSSAGHQPA
jgi:DNA-binding NarL/FixJ family response regulator